MFGNVSWGREASPPRTSPSRTTCTPRGRRLLLATTAHSVYPSSHPWSLPRCCHRGALRGTGAGCREARAQGWGEAKVAGEREVGRAPTQTPSSPSSAHAWAAPEPPGNKYCPPTRSRAGQRSRDSERESSEALPARGCAEPDRWGSWAGNSGPAPLRPSGRAPPSAPEPRSESDSCARGNWVFPNRAQPLGEKVPAVAAGGGQILTFSTRRPERERGGEKHESPQRGRGPSSGARLHSFYLGRNSLFSKKKEKKKKMKGIYTRNYCSSLLKRTGICM